MKKLELVSADEFFENHKELTGHRLLMRNLHNMKHCSADIFGNCVVGTLVIPDKKNFTSNLLECGFYMDMDRLIIIGDESHAKDIFDEIMCERNLEGDSSYLIMLELLEYLVRDDLLFLEEYEKKLNSVEEMVMEDIADLPGDFDIFVARYRKEIREMSRYYQLLADLADVLEEAMIKEQREKERQLFSYLGNKVDRLYHDSLAMSEYALQIRDIYQSKISMEQNKVMQLLTIVTTIFMPLTLIAGWYGMNFRMMPELELRYGYLFICILALVIVIIEIVIFKRKKWF